MIGRLVEAVDAPAGRGVQTGQCEPRLVRPDGTQIGGRTGKQRRCLESSDVNDASVQKTPTRCHSTSDSA
jgi:hypothetical protein